MMDGALMETDSFEKFSLPHLDFNNDIPAEILPRTYEVKNPPASKPF